MGNKRDLSTPENRDRPAQSPAEASRPKPLILLVFTLISIFIRLPFFFRDYIDRDESTFILMGQAWIDGFLPYTELWDVKPPLTFFFFAAIIFLFGKSFLAIRLAGALLVALTAYSTYALSLKMSHYRVALFAGVACIFLLSMFGSIQGVMSEHVLMAFFMAALSGILYRQKWYHLPLAGMGLGIALMVKINIAFSVLLIGGYLLYHYLRRVKPTRALLDILSLSVPAGVVVFFTFLPYLIKGQAHIWWDSVILAPLAYSEAGNGTNYGVYGLVLLVVLLLAWGWKKGRLRYDKMETWVIVAGILGILLSFLKGGRLNSHYLIQLYPLLLVITGILLSPEIGRIGKAGIRWILVGTVLLPVETYLEYYHVLRYKIERGSFYNGEGFTAPAYLKENGLDMKKTLFLEYHIGYWILGIYPPVKTATHPSNICKEEMFPYYNSARKTALQELKYIMESVRPEIVVTRANRLVFDRNKVRENRYIDSVLNTDYRIRAQVDNANILSRLKR